MAVELCLENVDDQIKMSESPPVNDINDSVEKTQKFTRVLRSREPMRLLTAYRKPTKTVAKSKAKQKVQEHPATPVDFSCTVCGKQCPRKKSLTYHMRTHVARDGVECNFCGKKCSRKKGLVDHIRTHTKEKPFQCEFCERKFPTRSDQRKHESRHVGEKRYKCKECGMLFSGRGSLMYHLKVHSGEKPFKCEECDKSFIVKSALRRHIRVHTGERPFACPHCDVKFGRSSHLKDHIRKHTGESLYTCQHCDKKINDKKSFEYHLMRHAGIKPFPCNHCESQFTIAQHLRRHLSSVHKDIVDVDKTKSQEQSKEIRNGDANASLASMNLESSTAPMNMFPLTNGRKNRSFSCTYCPKQFVHKRSLEYHLTFHEKMLSLKKCSNGKGSKRSLDAEISSVQCDLGAALFCEIGMTSQSKTNDEHDNEHESVGDSLSDDD